MNFPGNLSLIELDPNWVKDEARDQGGNVWETEDADPFWTGRLSTTKLNHDRLQDWVGFVHTAVRDRLAIEFVDPVFYIPAAYRGVGLPGGWDGLGTLFDISNGLQPVFSGLPVGLQLRRGDRLSIFDTDNCRYHMVESNLVVASATEQMVPITPAGLPNVFEAGDSVSFLNPRVLLNIVPNSWRVTRTPRQEPVGTFQVEEASVR